jgi:hypothetical protein
MPQAGRRARLRAASWTAAELDGRWEEETPTRKADATRWSTTTRRKSNKDVNLARPPLLYFFSLFFLLFLRQTLPSRGVEQPLFADQLLLPPATILNR